MLKLIKIFNRPLSPHLTVYSSQFTSLFSIWHRASGIILIMFLVTSLYSFKVISYKIFTTSFNPFYANFWIYNALYLNLILFFVYHVLNGLRHIIWDLGYNLSLNSIKLSILMLIIFLIGSCIFLIRKILI